MEIPVSIFIDSEPDTYGTIKSSPGERLGTESLRICIDVWNSFRQQHEKLTNRPVHFNWLLRSDPGMNALGEPLEKYVNRERNHFDDLLAQGDHIGLHFHPYFWDELRNTWVAELDNKDWISTQLRQAVSTFKTVFGFGPKSIRWSDNAYISNWSLNLMEELGINLDVSLHRYNRAIFINIPINGTVNSDTYINLPDYPYKPDVNDFTRAGEEKHHPVTLIPTSVGNRLLAVKDHTLENGYRLDKQHVALDLAYDPEAFREALNERLRTLRQPHLIIPHNSNVVTDTKFTKNFYENLQTLANHPLAKSFVFCTAPELVKKVNNRTVLDFNSYGFEYMDWLQSVANNKTDEYMQLRFNYMLLDNYKIRIEKEWAEKVRQLDELKAELTTVISVTTAN